MNIRPETLSLFLFACTVHLHAQPTALGYVNVPMPPGFSMISAPLRSDDITLAALFNNSRNNNPPLPDGFRIFLFRGGYFDVVTWNRDAGQFSPESLASEELLPGGGFFVHNPSTETLIFTVAGEILQGDLSNSIPAGFSIRSSMVPQEGTPEQLGFPTDNGDSLYIFDTRGQRFTIHTFDDLDNAWLPPLPEVSIGQSFYVRKQSPAVWSRNFLVENSKSGRAFSTLREPVGGRTFEWVEFFGPGTLAPGDLLTLDFTVIPPPVNTVESFDVGLDQSSGTTFLDLAFRDGKLHGLNVPQETFSRCIVHIQGASQSYKINLNGQIAGPFPLPAPATSVGAFRMNFRSEGPTNVAAWIENVQVRINGQSRLDVNFDTTHPTPRPPGAQGTLNEEIRH